MIVALHPKQIKPICALYSIVDPLPVEGVACPLPVYPAGAKDAPLSKRGAKWNLRLPGASMVYRAFLALGQPQIILRSQRLIGNL